jgi:hypothetical protein
MIVYGGWSSAAQFSDLFILETIKLTWSNVASAGLRPARWNHASLSVPAVPHWQLFIYGGSGADADDDNSNKDKVNELIRRALLSRCCLYILQFQGDYLESVLVLDAGTLTWTDLTPAATSQRATIGAGGGSGAAATAIPPNQASSDQAAQLVVPHARADATMVYDSFNKRIFVFG